MPNVVSGNTNAASNHDRREGGRDGRRGSRRDAGRVRPPGSLTSRATFGRGILGDVAESPTGTVTFLFTDVEGSTAAWEQHPDAMRAALVAHDELLRSTISTHGGYVFSTGGDGFAVAFARAEHAIRVAVESQAALARASWPDGLALRVRMGIHSGETDERGGDYFGPAVNRAARVTDAANGAQILVSAATREIAAGRPCAG